MIEPVSPADGLPPLPEPDLLADCAQGFVHGWTEAKVRAYGAACAALELQQRKDAERYRWLRDNPLWSVGYRLKRGKREWRMRQEGEYWGEWWPTHEQAVDHAMALEISIAAARRAVGAA